MQLAVMELNCTITHFSDGWFVKKLIVSARFRLMTTV